MTACDVHLATAKELAATLRIKLPTVYRLASNGQIPAVRVGTRSMRFDTADVLRHLKDKPEVRTDAD